MKGKGIIPLDKLEQMVGSPVWIESAKDIGCMEVASCWEYGYAVFYSLGSEMPIYLQLDRYNNGWVAYTCE